MRRHVNRVAAAAGLLAALPAIAVAERVRPGLGRRVALRAIGIVAAACGVRFVVENEHPLDRARRYVFVPNHSSLLDIPAMLVARPEVRFVAAAELFSKPFLGAAMRALGALPIERSRIAAARRQLEALAALATGELAVFAEGGIAPSAHRLPFKTGAFALAIETGADVVPVAITGAGEVLPPGARLGIRPGTVHVRLLAPIGTAGLALRDRRALRDATERAVLAAIGEPV